MLSEQQNAQVDAIIEELLDLQGSSRRECWRSSNVNDPAVHAEVESCLRAAESMGDFLSQPARPGAVASDDDDLTVGTVLGGWRFSALIGRGGMGEVYEAV